MKQSSSYISQGALIAALYTVLTIISNILGLANGIVQIRFSEALTILPVYTPAAIPGLFVGCIISNIITGCSPLDVIFGSLATLLAAELTRKIRAYKLWAGAPPIVVNTLVIPLILSLVYNFEGSMLYFMLTVFVGELISAGLLGQLLRKVLDPYRNRLGW